MDKTEGSSSRNRFSSKEVISAGKKLHQRSKKERKGVSNQLEMLHVKLRAIEEDTNHMKKAVVRCVDERLLLMSEIARQLRFIRGCLVSLQGGGDGSAAASSSSVSPLKVRMNTKLLDCQKCCCKIASSLSLPEILELILMLLKTLPGTRNIPANLRGGVIISYVIGSDIM